MPTKEAKSSIRLKFFELLFGTTEGFVCIATTNPELPKASFKQKFFEWPTDYTKLENYIIGQERHSNVYFCPNILSERQRVKGSCLPANLLWADLDEVDPDTSPIPPPIVIATSPGRFQAIWRLSTDLPPYQAEDYSKRLAYTLGADKSGWDLGQLLRVPLTVNYKYKSRPQIQLLRALETTAPPLLFEGLSKPENGTGVETADVPMPDLSVLPAADEIIYKYTAELRNTAFSAIYPQEPAAEEDWSRVLWRLIHILFEAGMTMEEAFVVSNSAPCNKYARDKRPLSHLWQEVIKADLQQKSIYAITGDFSPLTMPRLVDEPASQTFVDSYREWATEATDAVPQFHDLSSVMLMSSVVANSIRCKTSYGPMVPNLWGMILGDSTLTRKTTAMRMALDMIINIDPEMIVATDGSAEGLLTGLEGRPNKASLFYKDEISGFFDSINKKEYLAGMPEILTHLYDVPQIYIRKLRKENIRLESPAFIFFGGGVRDRVYEAITEEYIVSGFLPRFLVVSGDTNLARLRRTGPANEVGEGKRKSLSAFIADLYENYSSPVQTRIGGQVVLMPPRIMAELTPKAWELYQSLEGIMVEEAADSSIPILALPTLERLSRSMLKMAMIFAASRQEPKTKNDISVIQVSEADVTNAAWYIQDWGRFSVELIQSAGKRASERLLDKILRVVAEKPGILRSTLMQHYHLTKREADDILSTLEDRMLVRKEKQGRGWRYYIA